MTEEKLKDIGEALVWVTEAGESLDKYIDKLESELENTRLRRAGHEQQQALAKKNILKIIIDENQCSEKKAKEIFVEYFKNKHDCYISPV